MHLKNAWCTFVFHFPLPWLFGYYWLGGFRCNNQQVHNWERNSFFIFRVILEMCTKRNAFYFSYCRFICNIQTHTKLKDYHLFWDIIIYWHFRNVSINTHTHTHNIYPSLFYYSIKYRYFLSHLCFSQWEFVIHSELQPWSIRVLFFNLFL